MNTGDIVVLLQILVGIGISTGTVIAIMNLLGLGKSPDRLSDQELDDARQELEDFTGIGGYVLDEPADAIDAEIDRRKSLGTWTLPIILVCLVLIGIAVSVI